MSSKTIWSSSALCWRPRDGNISLVIPQSVGLASASVCMVMSGFEMLLTCWDELSMLLIDQCISDTVFEDKLIFPSNLPLGCFKPLILLLSKCQHWRGPKVTAGQLVTTFPNILASSLKDI